MAEKKRAREFEKLGVFYLGREYSLKRKAIEEGLLLYDSKDLTTHAVCVGMTGSGKTGLCISLLEEAAIDGVPAIIIDPKGDMPNLMLTFPKLRAEDFLPWVSEEDARKKDLTLEAFAAKQAETWSEGLAEWMQSGERIERLRQAADVVVYTPGSTAGLPVSILQAFEAPAKEVLTDPELLSERIQATVASLLGLVGIEADPVQSREHILLSTILETAWSAGVGLDLAALIQQVQRPPMQKIGVLDLESFYPEKDRFNLVLALNNLLAAPGFGVWLEGTPLDIGRLLHNAQGKPQLSIFSIAHLSETERMFFVTLLLTQLLGWVRAQSGTSSLRAILYMDELFGYLPPVAQPPSKKPLLTLLKQARASGLGVVLATQNPVDLDYKALSNTGTWFIGRLQTERDKLRVMEALEGWAAGANVGFKKSAAEQDLAGLSSRVFLMHNVHEDGPVVFHSRWAMSYLAGPMTREQIKRLVQPGRASQPATRRSEAMPAAPPSAPAPGGKGELSASAPPIPAGVDCFYLPVRRPAPSGARIVYHPLLFGGARLAFGDATLKIDGSQDVSHLARITDAAVPVDWAAGQPAHVDAADLTRTLPAAGEHAALPVAAGKAKNYATWARLYKTWLAESQMLTLWRSADGKQVSRPGESEGDFRVRLQQAHHEVRDEQIDKLRTRYASRLQTLKDRVRRAEHAVEREKEQAAEQKTGAMISVGSTLVGALVGRKLLSHTTVSRASTAAKSVSRSARQAEDVDRAEESLEAVQQQLKDLEAEFEAESNQVKGATDPLQAELEQLSVRPKKTGITVQVVALVWAPHWQQADGSPSPAWLVE